MYFNLLCFFLDFFVCIRVSVLDSVGLVPSAIVSSCLRSYFVGQIYFLVGIAWVKNILSWVFRTFKLISRGFVRGSKIFSRGYFLVQNIFSWVHFGPKIFSRKYFVGPKFFLVRISWVQRFFTWVFCWPEFFSRGFKVFSCG